MNGGEIIKEAIKQRGFTQKMAADMAGYSGQSSLAELIRKGNRMWLENFVKVLDSMGYEVVVKDKNSANKTTWKVG